MYHDSEFDIFIITVYRIENVSPITKFDQGMIMGDKLLLKIWWGMSRIIWRGREGYDLVVRILKPGEPSTKENRGGGRGLS